MLLFGFVLTASAQNAAQRKALAQLSVRARAITDGVQATTVPLYAPSGLAYDASGNLFVAILGDHVIRKIDSSGTITTVAGNGQQGFLGDNGPATDASLDSPVGIAIDANSALYIADSHNHRIRKVAGGSITTIAGSDLGAGFSGDGGQAVAAQLFLPTAVSVDASGNILIADTNNQRIRKIVNGIITTVAGNGEQGLDSANGDNGPAIAAHIDSPNGVAFDTLVAGKFYISDTHNHRIRMVDAAGIITTIAGNGTVGFSGDGQTGTQSGLALPRGLAVDALGRVYIADSANNRVRIITNGVITTIAGNGTQGFTGDSGLATNASLDTPRTTAVSGLGLVALADTNNQRVRAVDASGNISTIAGLAPTASESLTLSGATSTIYGSGSLTVTFANGSQTASGTITLLDGITPAGTATLSANTATLSLATLKAGQHTLTASYAGDTSNPAVVSGVYVVTVTPLALSATANPISVLFGQPIPVLTGTLSGVLPADTANVAAVFTTTATQTSPTGLYPITVALTGSAAPNYSVTLTTGGQTGPSGVTIVSSSSRTTLATSNPAPALSAPVTLTATVASTTTGVPTGTVQFRNGSITLGTATVGSNGVATLVVSSLPIGVSSITAVYSGDTNFATSTSLAVTETVTSAEFTFTLSTTGNNANQIVSAGVAAPFPFTVTPALATFPQAVTFAVTGLPAGATYTLTPTSIAAGAGATNMVLTVVPVKVIGKLTPHSIPRQNWPAIALGMLLLPFGSGRFRRLGKRFSRRGLLLVWMVFGLAAAGAISGCGGGVNPQNYNIVVTATSGSISHSVSLNLTVQ